MNTKQRKKDPVTSYGIINIHMTNELKEYSETLKLAFNNNSNINIEEIEAKREDYEDLYKLVEKNLLFLLVSRKHSLGFIEFLRGNYDISGSDPYTTVEHLFKQMTENEIIKIFTKNFDELWCGLWKKNARKPVYTKEYLESKEKFEYVLRNYDENSFKPEYPISEWGFPKGRKNESEANITCAIRECCEETSLVKSELCILPGVGALVENMVGTNNIRYKHIYYLSVIDELRNLTIRSNAYHFAEIDTIGWFKKNRITNLIRPYHTEKLHIVDEIIKFVVYVIHCTKEK